MTNKLRHLRSSTPEKVPTEAQMDLGQFAINSADGKVFIKKDNGDVKDITDNIFRNDTSVVVTDSVDGSLANLDTGAITSTVDGINTVTLKKTQTELKEKVLIENEKELRFYENAAQGTEYVSFKAPADLGETYSLTWPLQDAIKTGQLLGNTNIAGQLEWYDADNFGGNRIYVSAAKGDDNNDGENAPVKTIKRALQLASAKVYDEFGIPNGQRWNVAVAAGEYYENNPIIVPDNVSVIGDGLRACILRPLNNSRDMLRVRNGCYFTEFTFRDALTGAPLNPSPIGAPIYTFNYAVAFDDPLDVNVSRVGYTNLPTTKPIITTSPYIQNCSIISFLGGNGVLVDGEKVVTPNTPINQIEAENPVSGPAPEQGKSMVANAFTMLSFGGTGWRVINDAYVQIVSCFQIFMLNGTYTQSGGYCSVTNSATNFGLYALRSSGFSPNAFAFDKGYVATTGTNNLRQTITAFGWTRPEGPVNEFVVRIYDPLTNDDLTDSTFKSSPTGFADVSFNAATAVVVGNPGIFNIVGHGFVNQDQITYFNNGGTTIGGLFNGDTYFVQKIDDDSFRIAYDEGFTRLVEITSAGTGTQSFRRNDYEMAVNEILESHNTFQTLTLSSNLTSFTPGDLITGSDTAPPGYPHSAYVYSWNAGTSELVVVVNKVTVGLSQQRVLFNITSEIAAKNGTPLGSPITLTAVESRTDLWAATFEILSSGSEGQFTNLGNLPGKKIWFHRPSITNSSAHTWEYAGSGIDYNALPQNGGKGNPIYEQYSELAGQVYTSGTNELGDFKVGDFIKAFNRTGNVVFNNKVSIDQLDVLRLALSDVEITAISTDPDLGENEVGGPLDSRLSTQKAIWSYSNNRLGPFIDKQVSTNAVPGNIVQLNANGQINRDLIPSQRNFNSFITLGFSSRITLSENIPVDDSQSGDICTERYQQVALTLDFPVTVEEGWLVTQAGTGATGYIKEDATDSTNVAIASIHGTFETPNFNTVGALTINGDATPSTTNTTVIPAVVGSVLDGTSNYFISSSVSSQYLITNNTTSFTYTNVAASTAIRYDNVIYVESATHGLFTGNRVQLNLTDDDFDKVEYVNVFDTTRFSMPGSGNDTTSTGSTTATATIIGTTGTSTTGSVSDAALTGTITLGDWVFGGGLPLGSRITAVDLSGNPNTFTITFPSSTTLTGTTTASLTFITPVSRTGTVKSVITAADSLASGAFDEVRSGVLTGVNNLSFTEGTFYTPAVGSVTYLRVPLTNVTGSGTGATANITVSNGSVTDVDIFRGGTGYIVGDVLSAAAANIGGTGSGFQIAVTSVEQRIYIDIVGGQLFVATTGAIDFIEDNNSPSSTITATDTTTKSFNSLPVGSGGDVDYTTNRITISSHDFTNGDPVKYDPAPNVAMGGLITGNVYYVKSINTNTIELYEDYNLATQMNFGTSSTGTHNLIRYAVNVVDNSFYVPNHGFVTGDAVRMIGTNLPSYDTGLSTIQIANNSYFFVGSITTNSFTLHDLRSDALASVNGLTSVPYNINDEGTGSIKFVDNDITIVSVVNTSSQYLNNWSVLVADNIDASNIVSGIISTSRLALGTANTDTFLRGDSQWKPVVQTLKYVDLAETSAISTGTLLTVSGDIIPSTGFGTYEGTTPYNANDRAGLVTINVQRVNETAQDYSTIGVASFKKSHFVAGSTGGTAQSLTYVDGQVSIRTAAQGGDVDALTLSGDNRAYYLNSANHTTQPIAQGGTNITSYTTGDTLYASATNILSKLAIEDTDTVMTSTGTIPQWSSGLNLARNLNVNGAELTTSSTATGSVFNTNAVDVRIGGTANSIVIGSTSASQTLTSNIATYTTGGSSSVSVTANLTGSVTIATTTITNSGSTRIVLSSTTGIKIGQILSGSGSLATNTQVVGLSGTRVYINNPTTGSIANATNLTFTETNTSLGLKVGDQINIAGESGGSANLNGTWPITVAGSTSSTFTFKINSAVTLTNAARAGTAVKNSSLLIRNRNVAIGSSEASAAPVAAVIKAENAVGTNISGASLTLLGGLSTGTGTGGVINFATSTTTTTGDVQQTAVTRMTVAQSAAATTLDLTTAMTTANVFTTPTIVAAFSAATTLGIGGSSGTLTIGNQVITGTNADTFNMNGASPSILTSSNGTAGVFNTNALTGNLFGAATTVNIGNATSATVLLRPGTLVGSNTTQNLYNTVATTVNAFGAATAINVGANSGTLTIGNPTVVGTQTTQNLYNTVATTVNAFGAATTLNIGSSAGTTTVNNNLTVTGNFTVNGTTTTINATTITVDDKNIELGSVASPSDTTADGGGITLKGTTDKTILWIDATDRWTSNQNFEAPVFVSNVASGTAPFTVASTTVVNNLNADAVDGKSFGTFSAAGGILYATSTTAASGIAAGTAGQVLTSGGAGAPTWTTATNANTASTIVARDASGNFSAGTITATLNGTATQVSNTLTLSTSGTGLSGSTTFNGSSAATFTVTSNATNANTASTIVARDASGNFSAGTITATLNGDAASVDGKSFGTFSAAGGILYATSTTAASGIAAGTAGQVLTSGGAGAPTWTTATNANTASAIVQRDASGNFSAGTITASLSGNATTSTSTTYVSSLDGDRNAATKLPTTTPQAVRFDFVGSGTTGTEGNYAGLMTYAPWTGTTASTGDASYQLAFGSTATNGSGIPKLNIRKGIDSTWNSWYTLIHTGNTERTGWSTYGHSINLVAGQLAWKNYGNNHTIFDASAGTAPNGTAVNNATPQVAWTGTYPTLMGWNGSNTYGVRVNVAERLLGAEINAGSTASTGTVTGQWSLASGSTWQATFADLAEWYDSDEDYESGTVVIFGGEFETTISTVANDHRVAGVISTNPAFIMNIDRPGPSSCVALQGKVPVKVVGQVQKGDLLVCSNVAGHAMTNNSAAPYTVIGKALENKTTDEPGTVYVSVGR